MDLCNQVDGLLSLSMENEEFILDVPFSTEEVESAVKRLKKRKAPGHDNLLAEHLIEGGPCIITWLTGIMNAIIEHEYIPESFKCGLVVPIYTKVIPQGWKPCIHVIVSLQSSKGLQFY